MIRSARTKLNCWEFKDCGREPGGLMSGLLGECPVPRSLEFDGVNGGRAAGRACWLVGDRNGCPAHDCSRAKCCHDCDFYRRVTYEQSEDVQRPFSTVRG
jgi:hypothetical protein